MEALGLWRLWLQGLALVWGRAGMGLAHLAATAPPAQACPEFSQRSCEECLKNVLCLWCYTNNTCIDYPVRSILPPSSLCSLSNARWGVCWINFEALIIAIAVVAGLILVSIAVCCCYCCYCRRRSRSRLDEEEQLARKREERRLQSLQRKHERKLKHDEIRKKYGFGLVLVEGFFLFIFTELLPFMIFGLPHYLLHSAKQLQKAVVPLTQGAIPGLLQDCDNPYSRFENE